LPCLGGTVTGVGRADSRRDARGELRAELTGGKKGTSFKKGKKHSGGPLISRCLSHLVQKDGESLLGGGCSPYTGKRERLTHRCQQSPLQREKKNNHCPLPRENQRLFPVLKKRLRLEIHHMHCKPRLHCRGEDTKPRLSKSRCLASGKKKGTFLLCPCGEDSSWAGRGEQRQVAVFKCNDREEASARRDRVGESVVYTVRSVP